VLNRRKRDILNRAVAGFLSLILIGGGFLAIFGNNLNYRNYWGGVVFAPIAILTGLLLLGLIIFNWNKLQQSPKDKYGRKIEFPADDFEKW
jgi:hypothetical protein